MQAFYWTDYLMLCVPYGGDAKVVDHILVEALIVLIGVGPTLLDRDGQSLTRPVLLSGWTYPRRPGHAVGTPDTKVTWMFHVGPNRNAFANSNWITSVTPGRTGIDRAQKFPGGTPMDDVMIYCRWPSQHTVRVLIACHVLCMEDHCRWHVVVVTSNWMSVLLGRKNPHHSSNNQEKNCSFQEYGGHLLQVLICQTNIHSENFVRGYLREVLVPCSMTERGKVVARERLGRRVCQSVRMLCFDSMLIVCLRR